MINILKIVISEYMPISNMENLFICVWIPNNIIFGYEQEKMHFDLFASKARPTTMKRV